MPVIDIIVIAVLLVFGIIGMVKGFLNTLLSLFSTVASLGVAVFCAKPVARFLDKIFGIVGAISSKIATSLSGTIKPFADNYAVGELSGEGLKAYLESDGLSFQERIYKLFIENSATFDSDQSVVKYIGDRLAAILAVVIATVAVFILLKIGVFLLSKLFDALTKNRAINGLDRALGLVFGLLKASLLICVALGVFYIIANATVQSWIDHSVITKWLYQYITQLVDTIVHKFDLPAFLTDFFPAVPAE